MTVHSKTQLQQGKGKIKELGENSFGYDWKRNSKRMSALHIGSLLNPNLSEFMWIHVIFMEMYLTGITTGV